MTVIEEMASDSILFHQTFKRVWPVSQRDALFWSHVRAIDQDTYAVTNHSTTHADYPVCIDLAYRLMVEMEQRKYKSFHVEHKFQWALDHSMGAVADPEANGGR